MPGRFELKSTLEKIWHAPDHFRLMDPLPPMHRRGIIAGALLVVIGVLLPSEDNGSSVQASREANLDLQSQSQPQSSGNQAVPLPPITNTPPVNDADQVAPLFRDHNLPPTDVYAMAQVEGAGKPLSSLQTGQTVQIRQNASGVVTGLTIDTGGGQQVLFTRQSNGSFIRVR